MEEAGFGAIPCTSSAMAFACCRLLEVDVLLSGCIDASWGPLLPGFAGASLGLLLAGAYPDISLEGALAAVTELLSAGLPK